MYAIREAIVADVHDVAALLQVYMRETYHRAWRGSTDGLLRDGFGAQFRTLIVSSADQVVGFVAWETAYDLHHCLSGGQVLDLYVAPQHRSRGIAVQLIAHAAKHIEAAGGSFIKGGAVDSGTGARLYGRFAPAFGNDYILGGRAFRHLATLCNLSAKQLAKLMPKKEWNFEP